MESHAPTSWKWTSADVDAVDSRLGVGEHVEDADSAVAHGSGMSAVSIIVRISTQRRCGWSAASTSTSTLAARSPALLTSVTDSRTVAGRTASTTDWISSSGAPASTRAPSSMSPATPAPASIQRWVVMGAR